MKSRFDALTSPADRRSLAMFRSSGAVGVVLALLTLSAVVSADRSPRESARGDLLAMEIGTPRVSPVEAMVIAVASEESVAPLVSVQTAAVDDEFALPDDVTAYPTF